MHRLSTAIILAILLGSVAGATTTTYVTPDGVWWAGLSEGEKASVILAETDGFHSGYNSGFSNAGLYAFTLDFQFDKLHPKYGLARFIETYLKAHAQPKEESFEYHSVQHFIARVDGFYSTYPNRMSVRVGMLLPCISNNFRGDCSSVGVP